MDEVLAPVQPLIHCTPPTDPAFLATVSDAYREAARLLSGEMAVLVGTLTRLRASYPAAGIIALPQAGPAEMFGVWLISRDGWAELEMVRWGQRGRFQRLSAVES